MLKWDAPQSQLSPTSKLTIDDIAFGVLTSARFLETRLRSQKNTWLRQVRAWVRARRSGPGLRAAQDRIARMRAVEVRAIPPLNVRARSPAG